ncbi:MAG: DUF4349 domain-containing protein [Clostridiales bacterium]|jgi:hypothetical protein|nr:DUF4349 domain-containing protein [Clostridiales bacterium]
MKKRLLAVLAAALATAIMLAAVTGCAARSPEIGYYDNNGGYHPPYSSEQDSGKGGGKTAAVGGETATKERVIVYSASMNVLCDDLEAALSAVRESMGEDDYFESESRSDTYATLYARVRHERLDAFMQSIRDKLNVTGYNKTATDISLSYYDTAARIETLEAEKESLDKMLADATKTEDVLLIKKRLTEIDTELRQLTTDMNYYNSKKEFSEVYLYVSQNPVPAAKTPYGQLLADAATGAGKALGETFKWLLIALICLLIFGLPFGAIGFGVYLLARAGVKKFNRFKTEFGKKSADADAKDAEGDSPPAAESSENSEK